ncbi:hypothetical protein MGN70_010288 [Eutypa lata]|nr:hypothetical protein MGN70_010288 [Eutypa lata]
MGLWKSRLRFLDLEFNTSTKRIFEIGMCDAKGDLTLDYRTRYQPEVLAIINRGRDTKNTYMDHAIDRSTKRHHCVDSRMSARQVADRLREQGVSPRTWFVTWHHTTLDLSALREWLESEGHFDILPDDARCLPIMPHIRRNLKAAPRDDGRTVPAALSVLFPLVMGSQHELAGGNHHAAVDAQQAYYLTEVYLMQCRRLADQPDGWLESLQKPKGSLEGQKRQLGPGIPQEPRWSARLHKKQLTIESWRRQEGESAGLKLKQLTVKELQSPKKPEGSTVGQQQRRTIESFWKKANRDEQ